MISCNFYPACYNSTLFLVVPKSDNPLPSVAFELAIVPVNICEEIVATATAATAAMCLEFYVGCKFKHKNMWWIGWMCLLHQIRVRKIEVQKPRVSKKKDRKPNTFIPKLSSKATFDLFFLEVYQEYGMSLSAVCVGVFDTLCACVSGWYQCDSKHSIAAVNVKRC